MRIGFWLLAALMTVHLLAYASVGQAAFHSFGLDPTPSPAGPVDALVRFAAHLLAQPFAGPVWSIGEGEWHRPLLNSLVWGFGLERGWAIVTFRTRNQRGGGVSVKAETNQYE